MNPTNAMSRQKVCITWNEETGRSEIGKMRWKSLQRSCKW